MSSWRDEIRAALSEAGDQRLQMNATPHPLQPALIEALYDIKQELTNHNILANVYESHHGNGGSLGIWSPQVRELNVQAYLDGGALKLEATYSKPTPWLVRTADIGPNATKDDLAREVVRVYLEFLRRADELNPPPGSERPRLREVREKPRAHRRR